MASVDALANRPLAELWAVERFPTIKLVRGIAPPKIDRFTKAASQELCLRFCIANQQKDHPKFRANVGPRLNFNCRPSTPRILLC